MNIRTKHRGQGGVYVSGPRTSSKLRDSYSVNTGTGRPVGTPDMYPNYYPFIGSRSEDTEYPTSGRA